MLVLSPLLGGKVYKQKNLKGWCDFGSIWDCVLVAFAVPVVLFLAGNIWFVPDASAAARTTSAPRAQAASRPLPPHDKATKKARARNWRQCRRLFSEYCAGAWLAWPEGIVDPARPNTWLFYGTVQGKSGNMVVYTWRVLYDSGGVIVVRKVSGPN
jgi:hypothetical protein